MSEHTTTISVSRETRDLLATLGKKNDSFDTIVRKLIKERESHGK